MIHRFLVPLTGLTVLLTIATLAPVPVAGQASPAAARPTGTAGKAYAATRTPDGQPDLQGFWTNSTYTPLERPANVTKEFYTPEEAARAEKLAAARENERASR